MSHRLSGWGEEPTGNKLLDAVVARFAKAEVSVKRFANQVLLRATRSLGLLSKRNFGGLMQTQIGCHLSMVPLGTAIRSAAFERSP